MALSDEKIRCCTRRLLLSRMRLLCSHGFYGLLLMHMTCGISESALTVCTDGRRIVFGVDFLASLSDNELDLLMMREIMHFITQLGIGVPDGNDTSRRNDFAEDDSLRDLWMRRIADAAEAIRMREAATGYGMLPLFAKRLLEGLHSPQTDWRLILNDFIQEEIADYSFSPPDRRFDDSPFFLPDFNEKESVVKDILFMIDTSGSMSDDMITAAYSEVKGAIDQFDGKLKGKLGFFDAAVTPPKPFDNFNDLKKIKPKGGGGTDFQIIFRYVQTHMADGLPASIIILTDGIAPFPPESITGGIPVLWLLNNEEVHPPWGKIARIRVP